jgi:hypothetical protein
MGWTYSRNLHTEESVARVAGWFREAVEEAIAASLSESHAPTPSDFPLAKLDDKRLKGVLARMERRQQRAN